MEMNVIGATQKGLHRWWAQSGIRGEYWIAFLFLAQLFSQHIAQNKLLTLNQTGFCSFSPF